MKGILRLLGITAALLWLVRFATPLEDTSNIWSVLGVVLVCLTIGCVFILLRLNNTISDVGCLLIGIFMSVGVGTALPLMLGAVDWSTPVAVFIAVGGAVLYALAYVMLVVRFIIRTDPDLGDQLTKRT